MSSGGKSREVFFYIIFCYFPIFFFYNEYDSFKEKTFFFLKKKELFLANQDQRFTESQVTQRPLWGWQQKVKRAQAIKQSQVEILDSEPTKRHRQVDTQLHTWAQGLWHPGNDVGLLSPQMCELSFLLGNAACFCTRSLTYKWWCNWILSLTPRLNKRGVAPAFLLHQDGAPWKQFWCGKALLLLVTLSKRAGPSPVIHLPKSLPYLFLSHSCGFSFLPAPEQCSVQTDSTCFFYQWIDDHVPRWSSQFPPWWPHHFHP
jgi:hypothetical protein